MAKKPVKHHQPWNPQDIRRLRDLADGNTPTRVLALKLQRTPEAVQAKASENKISLKPANQSPDKRRRK